ncbi:MAG: EAL domain-containing protein, partial [Pseudohongiella sp.]
CNIAQRGLRWLAEIQKSPVLSNCSLRPEFAPDKLTMAVNLSARCLEDQDMPDKLDEICSKVGVDPANVVLEIGESCVMQDPNALLEPLAAFRSKGFQLSIDDFGTGYSSMLHLVRLPFTELKIDKDFVGVADTSEEARAVIKAIIDLSKSLGIRSVAEGVESEKTRAYLTALGCNAFQGYLISKAVNEDKLLAWSKAYCESLSPAGH